MPELGPHNAVWDDGEWVGWDWINSELAKAELREQYPNADLKLIPVFQELLSSAQEYFWATGSHLSVYGDIGELFGAITYGIKLHRNYAQGSDGRLGNDFVEVKTITPFKGHDTVEVKASGHFSKLLIVKIGEDFKVLGKLVDRSALPKPRGKNIRVSWNDL